MHLYNSCAPGNLPVTWKFTGHLDFSCDPRTTHRLLASAWWWIPGMPRAHGAEAKMSRFAKTQEMRPVIRVLPTMVMLVAGLQVSLSTLTYAKASPSTVQLDVSSYDPSSPIKVTQTASLVEIVWPISGSKRGRMVFDLTDETPLIQSISTAALDGDFQLIAGGLEPVLYLRVGDRDLEKRGGWTIFFDRMQSKPHELHVGRLQLERASVSSQERRLTLSIGGVDAGPFEGELRWTFYADDPFVLQEAVVSTQRKQTAFLYDMGLEFRESAPGVVSWSDANEGWKSKPVAAFTKSNRLAVQYRAVAVGFGDAATASEGAIALFPPPHRYFYPLDFSDNLKNVWAGPGYHEGEASFSIGIRHDPRGDKRYVPWFNAPPGTEQELGLFLLVSDGSPTSALDEVSRLTRGDRFQELPGHTIFSSHYHVEHTREILAAQDEPRDDVSEGRLPSGGTYVIPPRLEDPGFARVFRKMGIDVVHLAEFHFGATPRMDQPERQRHLEVLHAECARLSDDELLLLPGEEPNVHFGGHWISFFPNPVYWVLNRPEGTPFVVEDPDLGRVYHVGSEADVLRLLRAEGGLAWTAHPRIKGSTGYPDRYRGELFYQSDRFLGAAWKAMPADLSKPRLGSRVLDLLDDMSNWGDRKFVPGEVDVFRIEPGHELYGHMNVNYLRLDEAPRFEEGWQSVVDSLRNGQFFVTTGEVLIPRFEVNGAASGEVASVEEARVARVQLDLQWTFPLSFAEIVTGDGEGVFRQRIDLSKTGSHEAQSFEVEVDVSAKKWLRVEIWDIATNGAMTQPVWLE
jgi:hypothetical protein